MAHDIILDVDTGVDDAFALLYAARAPELNVLGVTCVDGNTGVEQVGWNTRQVLDVAGAEEIPVALGAPHPLMGSHYDAEHVHGNDGLGGFSTKTTKRKIDPRHAVELMRDIVERHSNPVTLVPVGPLTNVALFISTYPQTATKLERIFLMGGSASVGNVTATAEFNVWHDPEAAHIVFDSGIPLTMYGLDVFYALTVDKDDLARLRGVGSECATFAADLFEFRVSALDSAATLGDYGALASLVHPELTRSETMNIQVDTSPGPTRGQTICDRRPEVPGLYPNRLGQKCSVVLDVEARAMVDLWLDTVS
jgi:pyrimidine-specific ribonucleoside hydrolase